MGATNYLASGVVKQCRYCEMRAAIATVALPMAAGLACSSGEQEQPFLAIYVARVISQHLKLARGLDHYNTTRYHS